MKAFISDSKDPCVNAAIEENFYKTKDIIDGGGVLFFYVNSPTVVFGRSQNPWMEADISWCDANGIKVLRRFSGGGAVVHDEGNLNYSFFVPREGYDPDILVGIVRDAIRSFGIDAYVNGQRSIYVGDHKISGSAFAVNSHTAMAHGCILVKSDLTRLSRALRLREDCEFITSTVRSVRAPVKNLSEFAPALKLSDLCDAIMQQAEIDDYPQAPPKPNQDSIDQFKSYEWTYGRTPDFIFKRGATEICVRKGMTPEGQKFIIPEAEPPHRTALF